MAFFELFGFSSVSCVPGGVLVLLVPLLRTRLGLHWCASCWTRLFGGGRWEHYLCNHWRECQSAHKFAYFYFWFYDCPSNGKPYIYIYMLALAGGPSLHGYDARMVYWTKEALWRNCLVEFLGKGFGV